MTPIVSFFFFFEMFLFYSSLSCLCLLASCVMSAPLTSHLFLFLFLFVPYRLLANIPSAQKKFRHFEIVDCKKYREVWEMNEEQVMGVVKKVLTADKIVHEQILGLHWAYRGVECDLNTITSAYIANDDRVTDLKATLAANIDLSATAQDSEDKDGTQARSVKIGKFSAAKIQTVLQMLSKETGFLVDAKIKEWLVGLEPEEQHLYSIDAILTALGVEDVDDLDELIGLFYAEANPDEPSVHPNDIIKKVREFVVNRQKSKAKGSSDVSNEKRARKLRQEREFWKKLAHAIPDKTISVWDALEGGTFPFFSFFAFSRLVFRFSLSLSLLSSLSADPSCLVTVAGW